MACAKEKILLQPIDKIAPKILSFLKEKLEEIFEAKVEVSQKFLEIPQYAFNFKRGQYNADLILKNYLVSKPKDYSKVLLICDLDLYTEGLNFIFGEAFVGRGVAIISLCRLRQSFYGLPEDENLLKIRALKEAVHEIGHLYGLKHCSNPKCVMYFSNSLLDTDKKSYQLCPYHKKLLKI